MAIYDESLENIIENPDLDKGHIESRKKFVKHHDEQKREVKYEVMEGTITNSNPNGLRREIEITPYLAAYDEYEDVNVYVLYTEEELKQKEEEKKQQEAEQAKKAQEEYEKAETARKIARIDAIDAQVTYTAMMTDTLMEEEGSDSSATDESGSSSETNGESGE